MQKTFLLAVLLFANALYADGPIKIVEIRSESGQIYIFPKNNIPNSKNCDVASPIKLDSETLGFEQMYTQALAALSGGKKIKYWLRDCSSSPWGKTVPYVYALGILAD